MYLNVLHLVFGFCGRKAKCFLSSFRLTQSRWTTRPQFVPSTLLGCVLCWVGSGIFTPPLFHPHTPNQSYHTEAGPHGVDSNRLRPDGHGDTCFVQPLSDPAEPLPCPLVPTFHGHRSSTAPFCPASLPTSRRAGLGDKSIFFALLLCL